MEGTSPKAAQRRRNRIGIEIAEEALLPVNADIAVMLNDIGNNLSC